MAYIGKRSIDLFFALSRRLYLRKNISGVSLKSGQMNQGLFCEEIRREAEWGDLFSGAAEPRISNSGLTRKRRRRANPSGMLIGRAFERSERWSLSYRAPA